MATRDGTNIRTVTSADIDDSLLLIQTDIQQPKLFTFILKMILLVLFASVPQPFSS